MNASVSVSSRHRKAGYHWKIYEIRCSDQRNYCGIACITCVSTCLYVYGVFALTHVYKRIEG